MSYGVFQIGSIQYKAKKGDIIRVGKLNNDLNEEVVFDSVYLLNDDSGIQIGNPNLKGASVKAKVIEHSRDPKEVAFKFKRRKGYHRKKGFRRPFTRIEILEINSG